MSAPLLELRDLRVVLPTARGPAAALRGVSFTMARGEKLGLIGESGCGKSLTALALMGLLPDSARTAAPAYSMAWPTPIAAPSRASRCSARSLAVTPAGSTPSKRTRMRRGLRWRPRAVFRNGRCRGSAERRRVRSASPGANA